MNVVGNLPKTLASLMLVMGLVGTGGVLLAPKAMAETVVTDPATDGPVTDDTNPGDDNSTDGSVVVDPVYVVDPIPVDPIDIDPDWHVEYFSTGAGSPEVQRDATGGAGHTGGSDGPDICATSAHAAKTKFCQ